MPLSGSGKTATKSLVPSMLMALLGAGLLPAGCAGDGEGAERLGAVEAAFSADPVGTSSTNGFDPNDFRVHIGKIRSAMTKQVSVAPHTLNPQIGGPFSLIPFADSPLPYMLKCGLPGGESVTLGTPEGPYTYQGLLLSTSSWANPGGITQDAAQRDMFACLAAHMNASNAHVDLRLTGASVRNEPGNAEESEFTFEEAYWWAADTGGTVAGSDVLPQIHVWPLPDLVNTCGQGVTSAALNDRVCGNDPDACRLELRNDVDTACTRTKYGPFCNGHRVIMTWLRTDDVHLMYNCTPPPLGSGGSGGRGGSGGNGGVVVGGPTGGH